MKCVNLDTENNAEAVAPLVGAWIEIIKKRCVFKISGVAPLVGAWIEILRGGCVAENGQRRSPCGSVD